jgi:hypothetical protein
MLNRNNSNYLHWRFELYYIQKTKLLLVNTAKVKTPQST